jgi:hypothetical protein
VYHVSAPVLQKINLKSFGVTYYHWPQVERDSCQMAEVDQEQVLEVDQHWIDELQFPEVEQAQVVEERDQGLLVILLRLPLCHQSDCLNRDQPEVVVVGYG